VYKMVSQIKANAAFSIISRAHMNYLVHYQSEDFLPMTLTIEAIIINVF
jgi:hypothetical protein